jgi:predicted phosphodiesterase
MNEAIISIYNDLLIPISQTGLPIIDIVCVTGNHDRLDTKQTYVRPGENNLTYVIYKQLELLCKIGGLTNIKFKIATKFYTSTEIYGSTIVYEHGHELKNLNRDTMMGLMNKRQNQLGTIVDFYRVGHWHERVEYGQGKIQVNASIPGQDDYAEGKGFDSEALQILNYYVKTNKRRTSFFRSFPIYLEEKSS